MAEFEILKKDKSTNNILQPVAVYLLLLAVLAGCKSIYKFEISYMQIALVLVFSTIASYYIQFKKFKLKYILGCASAIVVLIIIAKDYFLGDFIPMLIRGIQPFYVKFAELYEAYYGVELLELTEKPRGSEALIILFFATFLLGSILSLVVIKKKGIVVAIAILCIPVILDAIVGYMPGSLSMWGMIAAFVIYFYCYNNRDNALKLKELIPAAVVLGILFYISSVITPVMKDYLKEHNKEYMAVRDKIQQGLDIEKTVSDIELQDTVSNYSKGGVGKGDFSNLSRFMPSGKTDLEVILLEKPKEDVYLKAYVGTRYTKEGWKDEYPLTYDEIFYRDDEITRKYDLMTEPFYRVINANEDMEYHIMDIVIRDGNKELGYIPYYAVPQDRQLIVEDLYIKGDGSYGSNCSFLYRTEVSMLDNSQLAEPSEIWYEYQEFVYKNYAKTPKETPNLVEICEGFEGDSVDGVSNQIDEYFRDNLSYSVAPGECPDTKEFVEYFLLENKEGFCVHFASAATIIYRIKGYPARYVEGYCVNKDAFKKQEDGTYVAEVKDSMAHAWCEIFDNEKGWQLREHTLGYEDDVSINNQNNEPATSDNQQETTSSSSKEEMTTKKNVEEVTTKAVHISGDGKRGNGKNVVKLKKNISLIIMLLLITALIELQRRIRYKIRIKGFHKIKDNLCAANIYNAIYEICVFRGMRVKGLSDQKVLAKMINDFPQLEPEKWEWLYKCAEKSAFDKELLHSRDRKKMEKLYYVFRRRNLKEMNLIQKLIFLYVFAM